MLARIAPVVALIALGGILAGCNRTTADGGLTSPAFASAAPAPAASGCAGAISEFQRVIDSDKESGNLNQSVHRRVSTDLGPAKTTCAAGRDADAIRQLSGVKGKYGYPEQRG
jgi:hypothetical protein